MPSKTMTVLSDEQARDQSLILLNLVLSRKGRNRWGVDCMSEEASHQFMNYCHDTESWFRGVKPKPEITEQTRQSWRLERNEVAALNHLDAHQRVLMLQAYLQNDLPVNANPMAQGADMPLEGAAVDADRSDTPYSLTSDGGQHFSVLPVLAYYMQNRKCDNNNFSGCADDVARKAMAIIEQMARGGSVEGMLVAAFLYQQEEGDLQRMVSRLHLKGMELEKARDTIYKGRVTKTDKVVEFVRLFVEQLRRDNSFAHSAHERQTPSIAKLLLLELMPRSGAGCLTELPKLDSSREAIQRARGRALVVDPTYEQNTIYLGRLLGVRYFGTARMELLRIIEENLESALTFDQAPGFMGSDCEGAALEEPKEPEVGHAPN